MNRDVIEIDECLRSVADESPASCIECDNGTWWFAHVRHHCDRDIKVFFMFRSVGCAVPLKFTWTRCVVIEHGKKRRREHDADLLDLCWED